MASQDTFGANKNIPLWMTKNTDGSKLPGLMANLCRGTPKSILCRNHFSYLLDQRDTFLLTLRRAVFMKSHQDRCPESDEVMSYKYIKYIMRQNIFVAMKL